MLPEIKKILYATDLSENARFAFGYAAGIADRYDAGITILHVLEELHSGKTSIVDHIIGQERWNELRTENEQNVMDTIKMRLKKFCDEVAEQVPDCRILTEEIIVKIGHPVEVILNQVQAAQPDLVVMGTHGLGMMADVMMGSTSRRVLRRCHKPVLIVRLPETRA